MQITADQLRDIVEKNSTPDGDVDWEAVAVEINDKVARKLSATDEDEFGQGS